MPDPIDRVHARVGDLTFDQRYADPIVNVDTEANIVEKETINDEIVVQHLGRMADQIQVEGIVTEDGIRELDELVEGDIVSVRTHRWSGAAVVTSTSSDYTQSFDANPTPGTASEWLYEVTISLREIEEVPSQASQQRDISGS